MLPENVECHVAVSARGGTISTKQPPSFRGLRYGHDIGTRAQLHQLRFHRLNSEVKLDVIVAVHGSAHSHYLFTDYYEHIPSVYTENYFCLHWITALIVGVLLDDPHPSFRTVFYFGLELNDPQANIASLLQNEIKFAGVVPRFDIPFNLHGGGHNSAAIVIEIPHHIDISILVPEIDHLDGIGVADPYNRIGRIGREVHKIGGCISVMSNH